MFTATTSNWRMMTKKQSGILKIVSAMASHLGKKIILLENRQEKKKNVLVDGGQH